MFVSAICDRVNNLNTTFQDETRNGFSISQDQNGQELPSSAAQLYQSRSDKSFADAATQFEDNQSQSSPVHFKRDMYRQEESFGTPRTRSSRESDRTSTPYQSSLGREPSYTASRYETHESLMSRRVAVNKEQKLQPDLSAVQTQGSQQQYSDGNMWTRMVDDSHPDRNHHRDGEFSQLRYVNLVLCSNVDAMPLA